MKYCILFVFLWILQACDSNIKQEQEKKIIATLFPQYDFTRQIVQDKVKVVLLLPPGVEPHSYEPTPRDIIEITKSSVFVYTGEHMEPWAQKIVQQSRGKSILILDASKGIELMSEEDHEGHGPGCTHHHKDPHIWLDPVLAQKMVDTIFQGITSVFPEHRDFFQKNAQGYKEQLERLHQKNKETLSKAKSKKILYAGHFAFGYFAQRYGLEHISPYKGFSPNAEPTPGRILELLNNIKDFHINTIFYEELLDPKIARVLSEETGCNIVPLHAAHNVSKEESASGMTYIKIMENNLKSLQEGLGCHE
ncbi:MAG: zinc ABC transporter substrate-binding protein [Candidatus Brocadiae bacterium]|nr:zinc ABC transporter substrate-binding protein [Candidatus Brocadiia bacterium]